MNQANSTAVIRSAINIFLFIAIAGSLFQELDFSSPSSSPSTDTSAPPAPEINSNGTKVDGLIIVTTEHFRTEIKELMIEKDYNLEIKQFPFEGNEYWVNLFLTHGHMLVVFFLVSKYQAEQDQSSKTKIMILGMVLVFGWMFASPHLKTKRLGLEYQGHLVYQRDTFSKDELWAKIAVYQEESVFGLEPLPEVAKEPTAQKAKTVEPEEQIVVVQENIDF